MSRIYSIYKRFKEKRYAYLLSYIVLFCISALLIFWYFPLFHKSFIWQQDGLKQHYNGLLYYSRYLKRIISNLFSEHRFVLPMWDFSIGYGSDIITTLHYYAIGDPLTLLSVFVPLRFMEYFYAFLFFLRAFIGGLGFSCLSLSRGNSRFSTLMGAIIYCFSAFGLVLGLMHGIFMEAVCYFPWMIYGADRIFRKKSPVIFILSTAAAAAANFYFFYMEILLTVVYALQLFIDEEQDKYSVRQKLKVYAGDFIKRLALFLLYGLNAFLLSAVILLPVLNVMFSSERFAAEKYVPVLYSFKHYMQLIADFMIQKRAGNWTLMGFTAVGGFAVIKLFTETKDNKEIKRLRQRFLVLTLFAMIPVCGFILNGFAYVTNRWTFAYALSAAMVVATVLGDRERPDTDEKDRFNKLLLVLVWCAAAFFFVRSEESLLSIVLLLMLVLILMNDDTPRGLYRPVIMIALVMSLFLNGWYAYSTADSSFLDQFQDFHEADRKLNDKSFADVIKAAGDESFFRTEIAGLERTQNSSIQTDFKGTQFYFSLTSPYISDFINSMYLNWPKDYDYEGVESRAALEALAAVKYFIAGKDSSWEVPAGFVKTAEVQAGGGDAVLYENENALPLGFTVDKVISRTDFDKEKVTGRQEALISGAVLDDKDAEELMNRGYGKAAFSDASINVLKSIEKSGDMDIAANSFTVRKNASVTISFDGERGTETYLIFSNLRYEGYKEREKYDAGAWAGLTPFEQAKVTDRNITDSRPSVSSIMVTHDEHGQIVEFYNYKNDYYCGRKNFLVNFGDVGDGEQTATISFREPGVYSFDALEIRSVKTEGILRKLSGLKENVMSDIRVGQDEISGFVNNDGEKLLLLSVPYSTGWEAYIDGAEAKVYRADLMYMALSVPEGEHSILLKYETPYLRVGSLMGIFGIIMFIVILCFVMRGKAYEG